jgi:hypothetical protein
VCRCLILTNEISASSPSGHANRRQQVENEDSDEDMRCSPDPTLEQEKVCDSIPCILYVGWVLIQWFISGPLRESMSCPSRSQAVEERAGQSDKGEGFFYVTVVGVEVDVHGTHARKSC